MKPKTGSYGDVEDSKPNAIATTYNYIFVA